MKAIDILLLLTKGKYENLELDIKSAENLEKKQEFRKSGERYKKIGHNLIKLNLIEYSIDFYLRSSDVFIKGQFYKKAIGIELSIFQLYKIENKLTKMASTYEKIASLYKYYINDNGKAGAYYFMSAKLHEENQNYLSAFKKARFACDCFDMTDKYEQRKSSHSLAFRMALQSKYIEKSGIHAKKWLELGKKDYSPHYISICKKGYLSFIDTDRKEEALMFVNEIIIAHYEKNSTQTNIEKLLKDAQKLYISHNKEISVDYNRKILDSNVGAIEESIKYSIEFKSFAQNIGLDNIADFFFIQEKELNRLLAKKNKDFLKYHTYNLWNISCKYGTNLTRWLIVTLTIIIFFGLLYGQYGTSSNEKIQFLMEVVKPNIDISVNDNPFSPFYFSAVTFTTLGYGDISPSNLSGQIISVIEVLIGYLMLGGLLSVFSKKIIR